MKQKIIGSYFLGSEYVELVLREGTGGEFFLAPEAGKIPRIKVGAGHDKWHKVAAVLLHEAMELAYEKLGIRYDKTNDFSGDHSTYLFVVPHVVFSNACAMVAEFMTECQPRLKKEWKKFNKKTHNQE
jgi:hypothetical protein